MFVIRELYLSLGENERTMKAEMTNVIKKIWHSVLFMIVGTIYENCNFYCLSSEISTIQPELWDISCVPGNIVGEYIS